ncbi:MAG TPA: hypothetical protein VNA25_16650 [Phycisphaerae bacterium]|nr:hypothetical protein [Phycisphaerae bacterium]
MSTKRRARRAGTTGSPALEYLGLIRKRMQAIRREMPALTKMGEKMAGELLAGGALFAPPVASFWRNEFSGRAGGLMAIRHRPWSQPRHSHDVCYFALPRADRWDDRAEEQLRTLVKTRAQLFAVGRPDELGGRADPARFAAFTGGVPDAQGLYAYGEHRPLAPLRLFELMVRGWVTAGEMIGAATRAGKMPIVYMSVWFEGSSVRNASMLKWNNLREPRLMSVFHENMYIPPMEAGRVGGEFLDFLEGLAGTLESQADLLAAAGRWLADAWRAHKRIWTVLVGHSYPEILDFPSQHRERDYPVAWGRSMSNLAKAFPRGLGAGDVGLHLGYGPVNVPAARGLLRRGVRLIHTTPYGPMADMRPHRNFLWFDLPWRPGDGTVDVPGYGVRVLPGSSSAQTMAFFAILCEMAERMGWR